MSVRFALEMDVELISGDLRQLGRTGNISNGGIFIKTEQPLEVGSRVVVVLNLKDLPDKHRIPSTVRWTDEDIGSGLEFERLKPIDAWWLHKRIHALKQV